MTLIEQAKNKDPDAFDELMQTKLNKMYRVAFSMLQNENDVADAIQETTLKCWQNIGKVRDDHYFETWLIRILINQCNDVLRERKRIMPVDEMPEIASNEDYEISEWREVLRKLNNKLSVVMELYYVDGFSTKEIAGILNITEVSVRTRMKRGRKQLEQMFMQS